MPPTKLSMKSNSAALTRRGMLALILGVGLTPGVSFANPAAEAFVSGITKEVMQLAGSGMAPKALRGKFAKLLGKYVNMRGIADFALGPYKKQLPANQREEFYDLVTDYAAALFAWYAKDFQGTGVEILSATKQGKLTVVQSSIKGSGLGGEIVNWRLAGGEGAFRVSDVKVKNVWLGIAMKQRFGDILRKSKGEFKPLFAELREAETWWQ